MNRNTLKEFIGFLSEDSRVILWLMYACDPIRVPEEVLSLLYAGANRSKGFRRSIRNACKICGEHLKNRTSTLAPWTSSDVEFDELNLRESKMWYLSWSLKEYMDTNKAGNREIRSLLETLLAGPERSGQHNRDSETEAMESEKARVVIALCALYFDKNHANEVVRDATTRAAMACSLSNSNDHIDVFRTATEPIIWLLYQSVNGDSQLTELNFRCVRQIFLKYVHERQLDDANISMLLKCDRYASAPMATLTTISRIYSAGISCECDGYLDQHHLSFLEVLVDQLKSDENIHIRTKRAACHALYYISKFLSVVKNEESTAVIINTPGILAALGSLIKESIASTTQKSDLLGNTPICTLRFLSSCAGTDSNKLRILNERGAMKGLALALSKHENAFLQELAPTTLCNLAYGMGYKALQILNGHERLLGSLILSEDSDAYLREKETALSGLAKPAAYQGECIREDGALSGLVRLLSKDDFPRLQQLAAQALMNLAYGGKRNHIDILKKPMARTNLAFKECRPNLQERVAEVSAKDSTKLQIVHEDGALSGLVRSLAKYGCPRLQEAAAGALMNLTAGGKSVKDAFKEMCCSSFEIFVKSRG